MKSRKKLCAASLKFVARSISRQTKASEMNVDKKSMKSFQAFLLETCHIWWYFLALLIKSFY